jgi:hypothetical protein
MNYTNSNAQQAASRSKIANQYAAIAKTARDAAQILNHFINRCDEMVSPTMVWMMTLFFIIFFTAEVLVSWPMYREVASGTSVIANSANISLFFALATAAAVAVASHKIRLKISRSLYDQHIYKQQVKDPQLAAAIIEERSRIFAKKQFWFGLIVLFAIILFVAGLSAKRVAFSAIIFGSNAGLADLLAPIIFVILEALTGIYLFYLIDRVGNKIKLRRLAKKYKSARKVCIYETQMAAQCANEACVNNEKMSYSKDLRDALHRNEYISTDNENFVDPVPQVNSIEIKLRRSAIAAPGIFVAGQIGASNLTTSAIYTSSDGTCTLEWSGEDYLSTLLIAQQLVQGPFRNHQKLDLDLAVLGTEPNPLQTSKLI